MALIIQGALIIGAQALLGWIVYERLKAFF